MYPKVRFFLYCFLTIGLFASCQPKDTFSWNAGLSGPKNYPSGAPFVEYFYQGKSIAGASSGTGADQGWGITSGGYVGGDRYKPVPDSIAVKWVCSVDNLVYKGGFKLPREKMLKLFKRKVIDSYGDQNDYSVIVAGMAPGGHITLWMQGGYASTEIAKFKILKGDEDQNIDDDYRRKEIKSWGNYLTYWKIHGIPYSVWEKGEKEYDYDIGFSSEEEYKFALTFYTKDGSLFQVDNKSSFLPWKYRFVSYPKNSDHLSKKKKLPVQIHIQWYSQDESRWFNGDIIMPQNLEKRINSSPFDRMIISIEKDTQDKVIGDIYLVNKSKQDKIMSFQLGVYNESLKKLMAPEYSLPKGFVFPKWEGREKIQFPELEYWQER
jgi:hypothetical protein